MDRRQTTIIQYIYSLQTEIKEIINMRRITLSATALIAMLSVTQGIVAQGTESTQQTSTVTQQNDKKMSLSTDGCAQERS